nr:riboflavin synthase [candidate division Zixibacteria bacterium]
MMFTGIIETVGIVHNIRTRGNYKLLSIDPDKPFDGLIMGESIAVDGCCLTVTEINNNRFTVEASQETIRLTILNNYKTGARINLERALLPTSRLGGHFVSGHIDCRGRIALLQHIGESLKLAISYSDDFSRLLVGKGAIAINGISLTVNEVKGDIFTVNLIPYTTKETTVGDFKINDEVNLEFDILGKYVTNMLSDKKQTITIEKLHESGW